MHRSTLVRCLALLAALSLAACAAWQAQHARQAGMAAPGPVPSETPGQEFKDLATTRQLTRVRGEVEETRWNLGSEGRYSCCVDPPCSECLLRHGACHCREAVRNRCAACGECTGGWVEGRGVVEGVSAPELLERKERELQEKHQHHHGKPPGL